MTDTNSETIDRYLLGQLSEDECHRLEARLLADPELFETAEAAEDELLDRYARGEMAPEERRQLELHLLGSERMRERIAFAHALAVRTGAVRTDPRREPEIAARPRWLAWGSPRLAWAATLVLAVAVAWSTAGVLRLRSELGRTRSELAVSRSATDRAQERAEKLEKTAARMTVNKENLEQQLEAEKQAANTRIAQLEKERVSGGELRVRRPIDKADKDHGGAPPASAVLTTNTRGEGVETLQLSDSRQVELYLDLDGVRPTSRITAIVSRNGEPVWVADDLESQGLDGETMALLKMPRQSLTTGRYQVTLRLGSSREGSQDLGNYYFLVIP